MSNNIRKLRTERKMTMRDLAEKMSGEKPVHFTTIAKIERSHRRLTTEWAKRFAEALDVSPAELSDDFAGSGQPVAAKAIPVIGMVAAGNWQEAVEQTDEYIEAPRPSGTAFGLVVHGHSMNKIAPEGATVIVDPEQAALHDGAYYVIENGDGDATFKQYRSNPARLEPVSDDSAFKTLTLGQHAFEVVGRVVGVYQQLM